MTPDMLPVMIAGTVTIIGALVAGIVTVITTVRSTKRIVLADVQKGEERDTKIQEIHLLVNSRLLTVLRLLVSVTKKMADKTGNVDDIEAYESALTELQQAEAGARLTLRVEDTERKAVDVEQRVLRATEKAEALESEAGH
jgi:hypothetical protein